MYLYLRVYLSVNIISVPEIQELVYFQQICTNQQRRSPGAFQGLVPVVPDHSLSTRAL
jgi:hypothetical protein